MKATRSKQEVAGARHVSFVANRQRRPGEHNEPRATLAARWTFPEPAASTHIDISRAIVLMPQGKFIM